MRRIEKGFPHKGWSLLSVTDAKEAGCSYGEYPSCEFCNQPQIRYVHTLEHPHVPETVNVGCDCAEHLTEDYINPRARERALRNRNQRRSNFPKRKWKRSRQGNLWIKWDGFHVVVISLSNGKFRLCINKEWGRLLFDSLEEAQLRAFDVVEQKKRRNEKP